MHNFASHQVVNATPSPACVGGKGPSSHGGSTTPTVSYNCGTDPCGVYTDRLTDKVGIRELGKDIHFISITDYILTEK